MAIDKGIAVLSTDLQQIGGIKHILLRSWKSGDIVAFDSSGNHTITSIKKTGPANAEWYIYEFKSEEASMTVNATKENGSTAFECGLSFMIPKMGDAKFTELNNMLNECMMAIAVDNNDTALVLGVSEKYRNESVIERSQTFLNLASMEGGTGTAFNDDNGITVNLSSKQFELPRIYTGTISYYTDADPSALYKATTT